MKDNCGTVSEKNTMYFHPDHLGSSSYVTDKKGNFFEMIEYLPYGETLYDEAATVDKTEFRFTSKEMDAETGLYYYGARYYDAKLCKWISADPILESYLPTGNKNTDSNLPGMGGAFNSVNLNLYHYAGNNPVVMSDPDGKAAFLAALPVIGGVTLSDMIFGTACTSLVVAAIFPTKIEKPQGQSLATTGDYHYKTTTYDYMVMNANSIAINRALALGVDVKSITQIKEKTKSDNNSIVIGENMKERVIPTAIVLDSDFYKPRAIAPLNPYEDGNPKHKSISLRRNKEWLMDRIKRGYTIFDVGRDRNNAPSDWYNMEIETIAECRAKGIPVKYVSIEKFVPAGTRKNK